MWHPVRSVAEADASVDGAGRGGGLGPGHDGREGGQDRGPGDVRLEPDVEPYAQPLPSAHDAGAAPGDPDDGDRAPDEDVLHRIRSGTGRSTDVPFCTGRGPDADGR